MVIEHKPDVDMLADYMSKSLQGTNFQEFFQDIMGKNRLKLKSTLRQ